MRLVTLGIVSILIGFLLVFLGIALEGIKEKPESKGNTNVQAGGVVMIGPIPLVFGTSKDAAIMALVLALMLMALLYFLGNMGR